MTLQLEATKLQREGGTVAKLSKALELTENEKPKEPSFATNLCNLLQKIVAKPTLDIYLEPTYSVSNFQISTLFTDGAFKTNGIDRPHDFRPRNGKKDILVSLEQTLTGPTFWSHCVSESVSGFLLLLAFFH